MDEREEQRLLPLFRFQVQVKFGGQLFHIRLLMTDTSRVFINTVLQSKSFNKEHLQSAGV